MTTTDRRLGVNSGLAIKVQVACATTGNITLSGEQTIDGILTSSSRVLVWAQSTNTQNGLYDSSTGSWTRCVDFNGTRDVAKGSLVQVTGGTLYSGTMFRVTTADPVIPGTSALVFEVSPAVGSIATQLADSTSTAYGDALVAVKRTATGAIATTQHAWHEGQVFNAKTDFGATGDGSTNDAVAIQAAVDAAAAAGGGVVFLPPGSNFKITTAIAMKAGVWVMGGGYGSVLTPTSCGAFTYGFLSSFGDSRITDLNINASAGTAQIGIYQAGTLNDADELYGVTIKNNLIRGFNTAIQFRTVRNFLIENNWIQDVNSGIKLIGKNLVGRIEKNQIVKASGSGAGTEYCIFLESFNYTSGAGIVSPEGIRILNNLLYGFSYAANISSAVEVRFAFNDCVGTLAAVQFSSVTSLAITDNYIQGLGSACLYGIYAPAQGAVNNSKYYIAHNNVNGVSTNAASIGIALGTLAVSGNVDGVSILDNELSGWNVNDINSFFCGNNHILRNRCGSSAPTNSIAITSCPANRPTAISGNHCAKLISYDQADFDSGVLQLGQNVISATTITDELFTTVASAATIALPLNSSVFSITGTTSITSVTATGWRGKTATLVFAGILTFTDGSNLKIAGNFVTTADDSITIACDGTNWYEVCRSVN